MPNSSLKRSANGRPSGRNRSVDVPGDAFVIGMDDIALSARSALP
jgi:hypothetical protein